MPMLNYCAQGRRWGRWVMGQWVTWVAIIRWVTLTWVMGQWVLTHDPSFFSIFGTYVLLQYRIVE